MKTNYIFYASMLLMAAVGCVKENAERQPEASAFSNTIVVNMPGNPTDVKTAFGDESDSQIGVVWSTGDQIAVIENKGTSDQKVSVYQLVGEGGTVAGTFEYVSGDATTGVITDVVYPASAVESSYAVPTEQTYVAGHFDPAAAIMSWTGEHGADITLSHESAIIRLTVTGTADQCISSVSVKRTPDGGSAETYVLTCEEPVALSESGAVFHIVVPGSETACGLNVEVARDGGLSMTKTASSQTLKAGVVKEYPTFAFATYHNLAVGDLYGGGVVFEVAKDYVKVVSLKEASGLAWSTEDVVTGCSESQDDGYEYTQKLLSLSTYTAETYPAVTWCVSLGEGWYLPSPRELISIRKNLLDLATEDEAKKTAANELMTSLGGDLFSWGMYWSSRENGESKAYVARLNKTLDSNYKKNNTTGYCTRAVKKIAMTGGETPDAVVVRETEETTYQVAMDTYFNNDTNGFAEDKCKGAEDKLRTRYISGNGTYTFYPFYKFDISNVTSDKLISATLKLSVESLAFNGDDKTNGSVSLYFYKSSTEWDESSLILPSIDKSVSSDCIVKSDDQIINVDVTTIVSAALDASETYVSITQGLSSQANTGTNIYVHSREATDEAVRPVLVLKTYK